MIGGVAAGPAAAAEAKRTAPDADVLLVEQGPRISYGACEMPWLLSGVVGRAEDLVVLTPAEMERTRGVVVRTLTRANAVDLQKRRVDLTDQASGHSTSERFDKLILATGAEVAWPSMEGLEGPGIHSFRTLRDAETVAGVSEGHSDRWVVIGGGYIGIEVAEQLAVAGHRVTLLAPHGPLAHRLDAELGGVLAGALMAAGIGVRGSRAVAVRRQSIGAPLAVVTDDGERIGTDRILVATGTRPRPCLVPELKAGRSGALTVDAHMRTSHTAVWACGDGVEVTHLVTDKPAWVPLSPIAYRTGHVAGRNAARSGRSRPASFPGTVAAYGMKAAGLEVATVGLTAQEARDAGFDVVSTTGAHRSRSSLMPGAERIYVHLIADRASGRLLGGQLLGADGAALRANVLVPLLRSSATVSDLYDQDLLYTPPVAPSLDPLLKTARTLKKLLDA